MCYYLYGIFNYERCSSWENLNQIHGAELFSALVLEDVFYGGAEESRDLEGELYAWVILVALQRNYCLPSHAYSLSQLILGKVSLRPEYLDPVLQP